MGRGRLLLLAFLLFCAAAVFWYTIGKRPVAYAEPQFDLFWSYRYWFQGDWDAGIENIGNIAMFVPLGFCGPYFCFEEDGATYIPCQVWTTQPERMTGPSGRYREIWDKLGFQFEKNELKGDFGPGGAFQRNGNEKVIIL